MIPTLLRILAFLAIPATLWLACQAWRASEADLASPHEQDRCAGHVGVLAGVFLVLAATVLAVYAAGGAR